MSQTLADYVAAQLRAEMARRQIPAAELARKLQVNENWVGRRMRGKNAITMSDLEQIANALEVPLSYFLPAAERVA